MHYYICKYSVLLLSEYSQVSHKSNTKERKKEKLGIDALHFIERQLNFFNFIIFYSNTYGYQPHVEIPHAVQIPYELTDFLNFCKNPTNF